MSNEHFITPAILLPSLRRPELPRHLDSIEHLDDEQRQRFLISVVNTATSLEVFFQNACQNDRNRETTTFGRQHRMLSALASYKKRLARHLIFAKEAKTTLNILERLELSFANHRPQLPDTFHSLPSETVSEMAMQLNWHSKPRDKSPEPYLSTDPISCKKPWHPGLLKYVTAAVGIIAIPKSGIHVPLMATTADKFTSISQLEQWSRKCFNYRNKSLSQAINKEYKAKGIKPEIDWKILMKNRREFRSFYESEASKEDGGSTMYNTVARWHAGNSHGHGIVDLSNYRADPFCVRKMEAITRCKSCLHVCVFEVGDMVPLKSWSYFFEVTTAAIRPPYSWILVSKTPLP